MKSGGITCLSAFQMKIQLNGQPFELPGEPTVLDLIAAQGMAGKLVAVEVNKQLVPKKQHASHQLHDGDTIEIVTFVGGG